MPATQFGGGERVGITPGGGNLISLNTLLSRTACTIPPHQNQNVAPLAVAIETSPKEVLFGCKMRIYCFKDNEMQIFRLSFFFFNHSVFSTCMSGNKIVWSVTSYHYNIYNTCQRFFCQVCTSMHPLQCITFPGPPALLIYWPVRPQGHPE